MTGSLINTLFLQHALGPFLEIVPALAGIFWGAPLVAREIETGTWRLAWTQSVSRAHWLAVKLAIAGTASKACPNLGGDQPTPAAFKSCIENVTAKFHLLVTYQPASRYWTFQWYETAIFAASAVVLLGICFWWIRHRLS